MGWIRRLKADYLQHDALFWAMTLKEEDKIIGGIVYWNFDPGFHCAEIGYELHPAYWQQGLMSEGIKAVLAYGFAELGLHCVEATPFAENEPSCKFLAKLGFSYEGNLRQRHFFRERFLDQAYFGLLAEEWQKAA
jgi:ribosomal-protein-alanine N-acetyltransferase